MEPRPLLLSCILAAAACRAPPASDGPPQRVQLDPGAIAIAAVQEIAEGPRITGVLTPRKAAAVRAEVGGEVVELEAELGERVEAGQVLSRIEDRALRNAARSARTSVASARSELEVAQREAGRTVRLVDVGGLAERDLELARNTATAAQARLGEARARLAEAERQLDAATVRSPMDGVVSRREVNAGDVIAPGAPLFVVIEPSSMRLEASVPTGHLATPGVGTPVEFTVHGYPDRTFTGIIERVGPAADPTTRQLPILVDLPNSDGLLIAGLFAEGVVETKRQKGLVVPLDAVDEERIEATVRRIRGGVVETVPVRIGIRDERNERVEILEGLVPGDLVLVGPTRATAPGTAVELPRGFAEPVPENSAASPLER